MAARLAPLAGPAQGRKDTPEAEKMRAEGGAFFAADDGLWRRRVGGIWTVKDPGGAGMWARFASYHSWGLERAAQGA